MIASIPLVSTILAIPTLWAAQKNRDPLLGNMLVRGSIFSWDGGRTIPLEGAEITLWRDDDRVGWAVSEKDGGFRLSVGAGSPIIVTIDREGYAQGKIICGRGDEKELVIYPTLLPRALARDKWQRNFDRFFRD